MKIVPWFQYLFIAGAAASAFSILFVRNVLHAVMLLLICLLSLSGLYVLLSAEFLAIAQILVYAGGVVVLILFGVMVTRQIKKPMQAGSQNNLAGYATGVAMLILLSYCFYGFTFQASINPSHINTVGYYLMTDFASPFELAGILLLVSLVGAAITARVTPRK